MNRSLIELGLCVALLGGAPLAYGCDLKVENAWVRAAPPNAMALAGYAVLQNTASKPLSLVGLSSASFAEVSAHETVTTNGMASMQAINALVIPANGTVDLAPGGKHLMLMHPKQPVRPGDTLTIDIKDDRGCTTAVKFTVATDGAASRQMDGSHMHHDM